MSEPRKDGGDTIFTSEDTFVVVFEGPGENFRRPRQPNNPVEWPPPKTSVPPPAASDNPVPPSEGDRR